jgi:2'-5' RNA ligase
VRLFIGVPVPASPVYAQVAEQLAGEFRGARPARGAPHITLRFLGEMHSPEPVVEALGTFQERPALPCVVEGVGAFPHPKHARIAWAGVRAAGIEAVAALVEQRTRHLGEPPERRRFVAHVTLARMGAPVDLRSFVDSHRDTLFAEGRLDQVVLFRSVQGTEGPVYERLAEFRLASPGA